MANTGLRPCSPGSRERATDPQPCGAAIHEDHVIEQVDRLEAQDERRIPVLLEDDRRRQRRFQAMRGAGPDHAAERAQRLAALLVVVGKRVQPALDGVGRPQARDEAALRSRVSASAGGSTSGQFAGAGAALRSATSSAGVQVLPE